MGKNQLQIQITWEEAMRGFLFWKQAQRLSDHTVKGYQRNIRQFFRRFPNGWQSPTFKDMVYEYMSDKIKATTYNQRLIYLRAFFAWCIKEGYLNENPMLDFKQRKTSPKIVDFDDEELQNLMKCPNQKTYVGLRDYALIMLTLDIGIRPSESYLLGVENIDLRYLKVNLTEEVAKTGVPRTLDILPPTAGVIHKLLRYRHPDWDKDLPVFCSSEGTPLTRHTWNDRLEKYSKEIGSKICPYDLRHAFALRFLRNGGNAFELQRILGHSDMAMTKIYVALTGIDLKKAHTTASPLNTLLPKKKKRIRNLI